MCPKNLQGWRVILIKSSYNIFANKHFFCTFGELGKLGFFWCYCDPWYVTFKLTLEGFKIIIASFWIKNKLLCTTFESDFQRSFYVNSLSIWASILVNQAMPDYRGRVRVVWLVRASTYTLRGSIDLRIWTSFSFRRSQKFKLIWKEAQTSKRTKSET